MDRASAAVQVREKGQVTRSSPAPEFLRETPRHPGFFLASSIARVLESLPSSPLLASTLPRIQRDGIQALLLVSQVPPLAAATSASTPSSETLPSPFVPGVADLPFLSCPSLSSASAAATGFLVNTCVAVTLFRWGRELDVDDPAEADLVRLAARMVAQATGLMAGVALVGLVGLLKVSRRSFPFSSAGQRLAADGQAVPGAATDANGTLRPKGDRR